MDDLRSRVTATARDDFGWETLRPGQLDAIASLVNGADVLAVMPTGYGKSAIYQVAGQLIDGPTVVVSPLIALQTDQVQGIIARRGRRDAVAVNSANRSAETTDAWQRIASGSAEYLFLSPEQLARHDVVDRLREMRIGLFVVDEAHCVSSWGHDFRPDYLALGAVIERLGRPTVVALTATGSPPVREEIVERLGLRHPVVLTRGFDRPEIRLAVIRHEDDGEKDDAVVEEVVELPKPGIVYVSTKASAESFAVEFDRRGLRAAAYHGGLPADTRRGVHERFLSDDVDVVVATSAFGMGIDKAHVRFVVHSDVTDSVDSYYQEIGRAGRDGDPAAATLHYREEDLGIRRFFASRSAKRKDLMELFAALAARGGPVRIDELADDLGITPRRITNLANLLEEAEAVVVTDDGVEVVPSVTAAQAGDRSVAAADAREKIEQSRLEMMRAYAETRACRRQVLLDYFGEDLPSPCGNCDTCSDGSAYEQAPAGDVSAFPVGSAVRHPRWGEGTVMSADSDRVTVFFSDDGYKVLSITDIEEHGLLETVAPHAPADAT